MHLKELRRFPAATRWPSMEEGATLLLPELKTDFSNQLFLVRNKIYIATPCTNATGSYSFLLIWEASV